MITAAALKAALHPYEHEREKGLRLIAETHGITASTLRHHARRAGLSRGGSYTGTEKAHMLPILGTIRLTSRPGQS